MSAPSQPKVQVRRPIVCIQGLGFVGAAMAVAVAEARDPLGEPIFDVVGIDLPTARGEYAVNELGAGRFPFETSDDSLSPAAARAQRTGNLAATTDAEAFRKADIVIVDIDFDLATAGPDGEPTLEFEPLRRAIRTIGERIPPHCLVLVETTVPPGTCAKVVAPELEACFTARGLPASSVLLAHSYERVMPGEGYLRSITDFWRVYAAASETAAAACQRFLEQVIDTKSFPLTRLADTTASETAKLLENSYRAVNIAFMEEWGRFAESVGIDLHQVVDAVRRRPTHNNIRQPGFGVGGYCLTKDPLFARAAARFLFGRSDLEFPFSSLAVAVNALMPLASVTMLTSMLGGTLEGKQVLLLGIAYRAGVSDTRRSPSETFVREMNRQGATVVCHDPLVRYWKELELAIPEELPSEHQAIDAVVLAVGHSAYAHLDLPRWLNGRTPAVLDANNVLTATQRDALTAAGCQVRSIGRGAASDRPITPAHTMSSSNE